jgi:hypothetical protein
MSRASTGDEKVTLAKALLPFSERRRRRREFVSGKGRNMRATEPTKKINICNLQRAFRGQSKQLPDIIGAVSTILFISNGRALVHREIEGSFVPQIRDELFPQLENARFPEKMRLAELDFTHFNRRDRA